ncbi:9045_t:CDS:2 [Funneliformis mosseae]|uniref:9045_t:CDS:1 n=1 Tax=Funneliformis mosseae TaxID=27381 RepID=A0A9N8UZF0_FUNMO|nr:9045_t:CDS:2 [Funneliformis mosseae]
MSGSQNQLASENPHYWCSKRKEIKKTPCITSYLAPRQISP